MPLSGAWSGAFHQCESDWRSGRGTELLPPHVERRLAQLLLAAKRSRCLAARLLLCDSLTPQLASFRLFGLAHCSTMRRIVAFR